MALRRREWTLGVLAIALAALFSRAAMASEDGEQAASAVTESSFRHFLDDALYTHIRHDRGFGPEHDLAQQNIVDLFEAYGLEVTLEPVSYGEQTYWNVVGTKLGVAYPEREWIVAGHYDSVDNPGADDDASGIAVVLEAARVLGSYPSEDTIRFVGFDREEQGLVGSEAYVGDHINDSILGMIQLDMVAYNVGTSHVDVYGRDSSHPLKAGVVDAMARYGSGITAAVGGRRDRSDHASFEDAGFDACHIREDLGNPFYHTPDDNVDVPDYIDYTYATEITRGVVGFLVDHAIITLQTCGDGAVTGYERCDPAITIGAPGSCPSSCETGDPCIIGILRGAGTCLAHCDFVPVTWAEHGDGCCPPGANSLFDDDCPPVCGNGVCEWDEATTCVQDCECDVDPDCDDHYVCSNDICTGGMCEYVPGLYADVDQNGTVNAFDVFCILDGIAGEFAGVCTFGHLDINPCLGNGALNVFDVFAVLDVVAGIDPCCGEAAAPAGPTRQAVVRIPEPEGPTAELRLVPSQAVVSPGAQVVVDVFLRGAVRLQAYEVTLAAVGEGGGELRPATAAIRTRRSDYVFAGHAAIQTTSGQRARIAGVLRAGSVTPAGEAYLGTCTFEAPRDSQGPFHIVVRPDETLLLDEDRNVIRTALAGDATVSAGD